MLELISDTEDGMKADIREIKKRYLGKLEKSEAELEDFESDSRSFLRSMEREYKESIAAHFDSMDKGVRRLIDEQFEDYRSIISEHRYQKSRGDIEIASVELDGSMFEIDLDFQSYSDRLANLYDRQLNLAYTAEEERSYADEARNTVERIRTAEADVRSTREYHDSRIDALGLRPEAEERFRTVVKETGGIGGFFEWVWTGDSEYYDQEPYMDTSRQEAYDRRLQELRAQQYEEMAEKQSDLRDLRSRDTDFASHERKARRSDMEREQAGREIERLQRERDEKISKERRKRTRAAKDYMEGCLKALDNQCLKAATKELELQEENIKSYVTTVISDVLSMACADKQRELDGIIRKLESGAEEIAKEVKMLTERDSALNALLSEAVDLRREIEDTATDYIEQL